MHSYNDLKTEIIQINQNILSSISDAKSISGADADHFKSWDKACKEINKLMSEAVIRVAVVGPIKSGKSTFANSIFKGDYLKRGAGIITSFVTKIRTGNALKADLRFKSLDEVNSDIRQAITMLSSLKMGKDNFDIRTKADRTKLKQAIDSLGLEHQITDGFRNINTVLISSYLNGYDRIMDVFKQNDTALQFKGELFCKHKEFVSDDTLSVYLKDIRLEIDSVALDKNIEIADCQGSDSPNPLHLAMIQDYLISTNLILYVISTRTGLRQADIKFLSMIKKMGIIDNILFVLNCDFNEHESIEEIESFARKVKDEISLIKKNPEVFTFSALFNMFKAQNREELKEKDQLKLDQWGNEKDFCDFSDYQTKSFESSFNQKITRGRNFLLLKNNIERLKVIAYGIDNWIEVNQKIINEDAKSAHQITEKIKSHQERISPIMTMIKNTIDGASEKIKKDLKTKIDRFFNIRSGRTISDVIEFIKRYNISYHSYENNFRSIGFSDTVYMVFEEFKHKLDTFIAEKINPEVIRFVKDMEAGINKHLESIAAPYDDMVNDARDKYGSALKSFGIAENDKTEKRVELPDIEYIKTISGITLPPAVAAVRYSAKIKAEAVMRFSFYTLIRLTKQILKKPVNKKKEEEILALKDSIRRIKRETEKSIIFYFKNYKENLKFQYFFKIVDAASNSLYEAICDRFYDNVTSLSNMAELIEKKQIDKKKASEVLSVMKNRSFDIKHRISLIREEIASMA